MKIDVSIVDEMDESTRTIDSLGWAIVAMTQSDVDDPAAVVDTANVISKLARNVKEDVMRLWETYQNEKDKAEKLQKELDFIKSKAQSAGNL